MEIRSYQFAKPIKYVLNPSSGLEIATDSATGKPDIQIALVIPRGIPAGNSTTATDPWISEHATMKWNYDARNEKDQVLEFSTFYNFASCIGDSVYSIVKSTDTTRGQLFYPNLQKAYVRVMANLKRKNGLGQNILFVAKYPAAIDTLSALSKLRKPVVNCDGTVFSGAPFSEINTFCTNNTSAYVKSDRFRRASNTDTSVAAVNYSKLFKVNLYPNPASNQFTLTTECSLSDITAIDVYDIAGKIIKRVAARQYIRQVYMPKQLMFPLCQMVCII